MDQKPVTAPLKIVFMGTPEFAVPALKSLCAQGHDVALVITQPDRPKGRGRHLLPPPVKVAAKALGILTAQPPSVRDAQFTAQIESMAPDLLAVVAYGQILPRQILDIPRLGAINLHASLLPKYRGAAPIQWAVINRETESGVTSMLMDAGMDTGAILLQEPLALDLQETAQSLHDRLARVGARVLAETVRRLAAGTIQPTPQDPAQATYAPLLRKDDGRIDWSKPAAAIEAGIRGMTPWPGAFTFHGSQRLKIFKAKALGTPANAAPGVVQRGFADELRIATGDGILTILEIQSASGKRLSISEFLRGHPIAPGDVVE